MSDVLYFVLRLAEIYDIDLLRELRKKIELNDKRYPADRFFSH